MDRKVEAAALVGLVLFLTSFTATVGPTYALCVNQHWGECIYTWGYSDPGNIGWLVPSNTTLFTPLITNASITGWVEGEVTIFSYQFDSSTSTMVGLYVNGKLVDNVTNGLVGQGGGCTAGVCEPQMLKSLTPDLAVFTDYTMEFGLYHPVSWSASIPPGSTVTLAFEADKPLWVSIGNQSSGSTYEVTYKSYTTLPATFVDEGSQSPHTVAAWVYSPNEGTSNLPGATPFLLWGLLGAASLSIIILVAFVVTHHVKRRDTFIHPTVGSQLWILCE